MKTILLTFEPDTLTADQVARVREAAPEEFRVVMTRDREKIRSTLDQVQVAAGWFPADLLPQASNLRWYQQWSAGSEWFLRHPTAVEADFVLNSTPGTHPIQITEHIFASLLVLARKLQRALEVQSRHRWIPPDQHGRLFELVGKAMLLIGVGAIGERTAAAQLPALGTRQRHHQPSTMLVSRLIIAHAL